MFTRALAANGATVYIVGQRHHVLETTAANEGGNIVLITANLTSTDSIKHLTARVAVKEPWGIHLLLVNNAIVVKENQTTSRDTHFTDADSTHAQISKATPDSCAETFEIGT